MINEEKNKIKDIIHRLKSTYRLVVLNDETFEEVASYKLTRLNLYVFISFITVLLVILTFVMIIFTPLKEYIPGYGDLKTRNKVLELNDRYEEIENMMASREQYIQSLQTILLQKVDTTSYELAPKDFNDSISNDEPSKEEYALRQDVEKREKFNINSLNSINGTGKKNFNHMISPVKGHISAEFDLEKGHQGIDIIAPKGTAIKSIMDGVVIMSDYTLETGYTLGIQHDNNLISFYKHNSILLKKIGKFVKSGDAIAIIGNSGELTDGPHLHFELWYQGKPVNPKNYLNF